MVRPLPTHNAGDMELTSSQHRLFVLENVFGCGRQSSNSGSRQVSPRRRQHDSKETQLDFDRVSEESRMESPSHDFLYGSNRVMQFGSCEIRVMQLTTSAG